MDPFRLLSRSTKLSRATTDKSLRNVPPSSRPAQPQLFPAKGRVESNSLGKRKRVDEHLDYFDSEKSTQRSEAVSSLKTILGDKSRGDDSELDVDNDVPPGPALLSEDECRRLLKQHKVKVMLLQSNRVSKSKTPRKSKEWKRDVPRMEIYPQPLLSLRSLRSRFRISRKLWQNIADQGYETPTEVQLAALPLLMNSNLSFSPKNAGSADRDEPSLPRLNLLTVAPTGSGKTLAFMIPLLHSLIAERQGAEQSERRTSAIILAPTKELASQITNEGRKLAKSTGVKISLMRKGMTLPRVSTDDNGAVDVDETATKADIIVSTPGVLQSSMDGTANISWQIKHLILDEADVLLDPTFREQTLAIWDQLDEPSLQVSMWSATMGSNIEAFALSTITDRIKRLSEETAVDVPELPAVRLVIGLKDSAVPNVSHKLIYAGNEKGKLMGLRQLIRPSTSTSDAGPTLRPPFIIFTQTVERAIALSSELLYDVPVEAGGSSRVAVLHSDLSDSARDSIMTRFRKSEIWVLITTDLLSRGVDFRGVNGVVNYDIPTSSAAYVHRIGRTGRAGRDGGVAVTLYSKEDIPYMKHVANVIATAQKQEGGDELHQWLLDALPKLSKNEKKKLKRRGIESRSARGQKKVSRAARQSRISTKAGFARRMDNNRKGAILAAQQRGAAQELSEDGDETDFGGFE